MEEDFLSSDAVADLAFGHCLCGPYLNFTVGGNDGGMSGAATGSGHSLTKHMRPSPRLLSACR